MLEIWWKNRRLILPFYYCTSLFASFEIFRIRGPFSFPFIHLFCQISLFSYLFSLSFTSKADSSWSSEALTFRLISIPSQTGANCRLETLSLVVKAKSSRIHAISYWQPPCSTRRHCLWVITHNIITSFPGRCGNNNTIRGSYSLHVFFPLSLTLSSRAYALRPPSTPFPIARRSPPRWLGLFMAS